MFLTCVSLQSPPPRPLPPKTPPKSSPTPSPTATPIQLGLAGVLTAFEIYPLMLKLFGNSSRLLLRANSPFSILGGHASKDA